MPTYPSIVPSYTVGALMRQPNLISRDLTNITNNRFVADRILARGNASQVAGGVAVYQMSESQFLTRDPEEVGVRSKYPRASWTSAIFTAVVRKYGLEVPIADETVRRNAIDEFNRAELKLANGLIKFIDTVAMNMILTDANVLTAAASGDWSTPATDIISDLANARMQIANQNEGYEADTLIVNPAQNLDLLVDGGIRDALPREGGAGAVSTGRPVPILGFRQILETPALAAGTVLVVTSNIVGTIADEAPEAAEGYRTYTPPGSANVAPVYVKQYREEDVDETIVRAARFPAMWLAEPKSAFKITGA
jgi:hypothetical protein